MYSLTLRRQLARNLEDAQRRAALRKPNRYVQPGPPLWVRRAMSSELPTKDLTERS